MSALPGPAYDNIILNRFSESNVEKKLDNKKQFLEESGLKNIKLPLFCISYPLLKENNVHLIFDIINGLLEQELILAIGTIGSKEYQKLVETLASQNPKKIILFDPSNNTKRKVYAAADCLLASDINEEILAECKNAMKYGCIPICAENEWIDGYNPNLEKGCSFTFKKQSAWSLFAAVIKSLESYRFPYDWKNIQKNAMKSDQNN